MLKYEGNRTENKTKRELPETAHGKSHWYTFVTSSAKKDLIAEEIS